MIGFYKEGSRALTCQPPSAFYKVLLQSILYVMAHGMFCSLGR